MSHVSLAAKYRPQSFAQVTGQDTIKTILSRAALENRIAPAYLFSGTRGVGKTTIARIFAKALNCAEAPTAEPCNKCEQCLRVTQGNHVDVIEIDGASNRGIDDARRIREATQYAPMEGRYKVFIIDEAHMLTKESFNALLKTLEEPPPATTFILATTEAHKFPITIVSRCQHFVLKALSENALIAHLSKILQQEELNYEEAALRLLARRASGSVRDAMSLLGQTLALSNQDLSEASTRQVLGLAGQELMERLLVAIRTQNCGEVSEICQELLNDGVDLGFFLRELTGFWRNLFILKQAPKQASELSAQGLAKPILPLPEAEYERLLSLAESFELSFIHSAWQMVLESQRQVLTSLEPGTALELLLLNLALLPQLLSLEALDGLVGAGNSGSGGNSGGSGNSGSLVGSGNSGSWGGGSPSGSGKLIAPASMPATAPVTTAPVTTAQLASQTARPAEAKATPVAALPPWEATFPIEPKQTPQEHQVTVAPQEATSTVQVAPQEAMQVAPQEATPQETVRPSQAAVQVNLQASQNPTWSEFLAYVQTQGSSIPSHLLEQLQVEILPTGVVLECSSKFQYDQLNESIKLAELKRLLHTFAPQWQWEIKPAKPRKTDQQLKAEMAEQPLVKGLLDKFDASVVRCTALS